MANVMANDAHVEIAGAARANGARASTKARFWIEMIVLVSAIACALAMMIAAFGAVASAAGDLKPRQPSHAAIQPQTYEGVITDSHCQAKHSVTIGKAPAECTRACVHAGEQFVLVDGDTVFLLDGDLNVLKEAAGQRVKIVGQLNGNKILVTSVLKA
jgi:hypothetical protein